jgi:Fe-S-cluster containining protein
VSEPLESTPRPLQLRDEARRRSADVLQLQPTIANALLLVNSLHERADAESERALAQHPPAQPLACQPGCWWCCTLRVELSAPEALRIGDFIRQLPQPEQEALHARLREASEQTRGLSHDEHAQLRRACPLLGDDRRCSVHPARPLACRACNSTDVDACERQFEAAPGQDDVPAHEPSRDSATGLAMGHLAGIRDAELDYHLLELSTAVLIAYERPSAGERWLRRLPVFSRARSAASDAALDAHFEASEAND